MKTKWVKERTTGLPVDDAFLNRWSPRAFAPTPVPREKLLSLFEAARWSPSSFNEQPWRFLFTDREPELSRFRSLLYEKNQKWSGEAPVIAFILTKLHFSHNDAANPWAHFDAGAAWMSLALQARKSGLFAHAVAGIDKAGVFREFGIDRERYDVLAGVVIGEGLRDTPDEFTNRRELDDIVSYNRWSET